MMDDLELPHWWDDDDAERLYQACVEHFAAAARIDPRAVERVDEAPRTLH
jgi:hypothetical protein